MGDYEPRQGIERSVVYRPRVVDAELAARLGATGAVGIEGPRGCGKTETARQAARSEVRLDVDDAARTVGAASIPIGTAGPLSSQSSRAGDTASAVRTGSL
jgi:hypothetical protein